MLKRSKATACTKGTALASLAIVAALLAATDAAARPNILFIFSDDHAYQAIGAYGSVLNETPNIDRIAADGVRFDRCYVTNSICGPSRACILTGKYSHLNGFRKNGDKFDGAQQTFPKLLQEAGYQTALIGKWHLGTTPTGFDFWKTLPGQGRYYKPIFNTPEGEVIQDGYTTDVITDEALAWLQESRDADKPFMLMVQHKAPHREWQPGPAHVADFSDKELPEPPTLFDDYTGRGPAAAAATMRIADHMRPAEDLKIFDASTPYGRRQLNLMPPAAREKWLAAYGPENAAYLADPPTGDAQTHWNYQRYIKDYLRCVQSVDDSAGRLLDYLDESGLAENTLVIYSSDQGFYLGEHGWYDKRWMYEESLRTPLLVRGPGVQQGVVNKDIVSNLDFGETFLAAAGVDVPDDMQGRSLMPIFAGDTPDDWRDTFYYHYYEGPPAWHDVAQHCGVTDGRYKLIHFYTLGYWELYDLEADPHELHSVYDQPDYAEVQQRLAEELKRLQSSLKVPPGDHEDAS
ncbi:MAG: sulfatase [Planctomycetaceae bacterium]|nr:sulfatase [Planctomycetaceae bacterium]